MNKNSKIYLAGHHGMVGSAILRELQHDGYDNIVTRTHQKLDLRRQEKVEAFFQQEKPDVVIIAAAKVGGILANNIYRADFIYDNLIIQSNLIHSAHHFGVKKLLFLGSSCIYPKDAPQPLKEEYLLTGVLEPTNEPYAVAKIAGIKLCESYYRQYGDKFFSVMPPNLYGPNDNYNLETSHVAPALIRKFHEAKTHNMPTITVWGSGKVYREFLYVEDMANACVTLLEKIDVQSIYDQGISHINIGIGQETSISELAITIADVVNYSGKIIYDSSKPDGVYRKLLDVTRLNSFGWHATIPLKEGMRFAYDWYLKNIDEKKT